MATRVLDRALELLRTRAEEDQDLAETIRFLAAEGVRDPFKRLDGPTLGIARAVNLRRAEARMLDFARRSHDTAGVVDMIGSISDRKGVDRRRRRGSLLGLRVGNRTLHPDWQFDRRRRDTYDGLNRLLDALRELTRDPLAADALVTAPRRDLDGRSIADVLAEGHVDLAVRLVRMASDQS